MFCRPAISSIVLSLSLFCCTVAKAEIGTLILETAKEAKQVWRFTTDKPADTWINPGFDDQGWAQGKAGFGTAGTPGAIIGTIWNTSDIWLRREFTIKKNPGLVQLNLHHDEDTDIYINGIPALKQTGWTTDYMAFPVSATAIKTLKPGKNTIAIHCRQAAGGQYIDAGLTAIDPGDFTLHADGVDLTIENSDNGLQVLLRCGKQILAASPAEGLWSIASSWENEWSSSWTHAAPTMIKRQGPWLVMDGQIATAQGNWLVQDAYRPEGTAIRCIRRWEWKGNKTAEKTTLSVRWMIPEATADAKPMMPGICYYGNPAGMSTGPANISQYQGKANQELYCEEHRFPMPFVSLEWAQDNGWRGAALHTIPSMLPYGSQEDQWWSLGLTKKETGVELAALSGPVSINGKRGFVKANQKRLLKLGDAWMDVPPGGIIEKTFLIEAFDVAEKGSGFRQPLQTSINTNRPFDIESLPKFDQILQDKYRFTQSRWHEDKESAGFRMYPNSNEYVMGWAGQSEAPGYALLVLADRLKDPNAVIMAQRAMDHLASSPFNTGGFMLSYNPNKNQWGKQDPISQGQAMDSFANAIAYGRKHKAIKTEKWEAFLQKACDVHAKRILDENWRPRSTNEGFLVAPLCKGFKLFGNEEYRRAALKAVEHYGKRHLDMSEPYWGGTLDARCEDKEGAWAGFQAFLAAYEMTKDKKYLNWAAHAMDVTLTYTVVWDIDMPPGRMRDHALKTRGWTMVSAQNQHLDVYGVLYTPEIYRMGEYLKRDDLKTLAQVMYRSCGQLIDPEGSQGEQINHTNFAQRGNLDDVHKMRGTYSEAWTVYWITAHFLNAAAKFTEMGIDF